MLDRRDLAPIHNKRVSERTGEEVPFDETVKGYEYEPGRYVVIEDEDFVKANVKATQTIDIMDFVKAGEIDPVYFERPYYTTPSHALGREGVAILREAMRASGYVGLATVVIRTRQQLAAVMVEGRPLVLELDLMALIQGKTETGDVEVPEAVGEGAGEGAEEGAGVVDIMSLLRQSVARSRKEKGPGQLFVVHKHAARRLHYDLRLEIDGVLASWAVPKGPSLDPGDRRLAVRVEDHPLEYGSFEGAIPEGEYGAGTVLLWDRGTFEPDGDPRAALERGALKFRLAGEKLTGGWTLVRLKPRGDEPYGKNWLLIKEKDAAARPSSGYDVLKERPESVASGRTIEGIAGDPERVIFAEEEGEASAAKDAPDPAGLHGACKRAMPPTLDAQLAVLVSEAPPSERWLNEIKLDGYRILARIAGGKATLLSRRGQDWTTRFPEIAEALGAFPVGQAWLDGEVVALGPDGVSSFQALQVALSEERTADLVYEAFDILYLDGYDLSDVALIERKHVLASLVPQPHDTGRVRYVDHVLGAGEAFHRKACDLGLEGIVSKLAEGKHRDGRHRDWLKVKCGHSQELVIGGFTDPAGSRIGFGALLVGYYDEGRLAYAGRVGTGFSRRQLAELREELAQLEVDSPPFDPAPTGAAAKGAHWVRPELVAEVRFSEFTADGRLRQPAFQGLRHDKRPEEVVREEPVGPMQDAGGGDTLAVAGVSLTHPEKVLYPVQGITKRRLAVYYARIADWVMPHIAGRLLTLVRCPEGHEGGCFYQKHVQEAYPAAVKRVTVPQKDGESLYAYVEDIEGLISLVQMGVLEVHTWGSKVSDLERPDRLTFDLDTCEGTSFGQVIEGARLVRDGLRGLGLESFVKTTGGKGLHVVAPIEPKHGWAKVVTFAQALARSIEVAAPERYTSNPLKVRRKGKVLIDYLRNARGATVVAAYSVRAREGAPVSVPLRWDELGRGLDPKRYTITAVERRLAALDADPWEAYQGARQHLTERAFAAVGL